MFIIECADDNSLVIINESQVICDKETIVVGDAVNFVYKKKTYLDQDDSIDTEFNRLKNQTKKVKIDTKSPCVQPNLYERRTRSSDHQEPAVTKKIKTENAPKQYKVAPTKKASGEKTKAVSSSESESSFEEEEQEYDGNTMKTKENPIRQKKIEDNPIYDHQQDTADDIIPGNNNKIIAPANMTILIPTDDQLDELDDDSQLFGQNHGNMFHIGHGIYCKTKICQLAAKSSSAATHVACKLLEGIFRKETLIKCTMTGKPPTTQGKERQLLAVVPMHSRAKRAIIEYSIQLAKKNQWTARTPSQVETSIGQKLVEIKAKDRKNRELLDNK